MGGLDPMRTVRIAWTCAGQSASVSVPEFELGAYVEALRERFAGHTVRITILKG